MKLPLVRVAVIAAVLFFTLRLSAQNANNPIQVALLRWYSANTAAQLATCTGPNGMAFDGAHIWVGCANANELQEFNSSDGALIRTVTGVLSPNSLAYDGANIWASNFGLSTVTEVNASTGAIVNTVPVGSQPRGVAFDGTYIWVANSGSNSVTRVTAASPGTSTTFTFPGLTCIDPWGAIFVPLTDAPIGAAFDGSHVWVVYGPYQQAGAYKM